MEKKTEIIIPEIIPNVVLEFWEIKEVRKAFEELILMRRGLKYYNISESSLHLGIINSTSIKTKVYNFQFADLEQKIISTIDEIARKKNE